MDLAVSFLVQKPAVSVRRGHKVWSQVRRGTVGTVSVPVRTHRPSERKAYFFSKLRFKKNPVHSIEPLTNPSMHGDSLMAPQQPRKPTTIIRAPAAIRIYTPVEIKAWRLIKIGNLVNLSFAGGSLDSALVTRNNISIVRHYANQISCCQW